MPLSLKALMETPRWAESLEGCGSKTGQLKTGEAIKAPRGHLWPPAFVGSLREAEKQVKISRVWRPSRKGEAGLEMPDLHQALDRHIHYTTQAHDVGLPGSQLDR